MTLNKIVLILLLLQLNLAYAGKIPILCYHEISDDRAMIERAGITTELFIQHLDWLHGQGYQPISIQQWTDAINGGSPLPEKPILLTFDDGYASFYHRVLPLLKSYNYPAVLALVGSFLHANENGLVTYGDQLIPRSEMLSWPQLQEIRDSGLVEFASHSYDMHRGINSNPQGNIQPAAASHQFIPTESRYENDQEYFERISDDLIKNNNLISKNLGVQPRVMVWPFGEYTSLGLKAATDQNMPITLTLNSGIADIGTIQQAPRLLVSYDWSIKKLASILRKFTKDPIPIRAVHVDLDYVWDEDIEQQERNLDALLERIKNYHINTVYLQAYSDTDGDSVAEALYFPNRHLPVKADLFNRVAWQLRTRADVQVFAWLPVMAFEASRKDWLVETLNRETDLIEISSSLRRLSPWKNDAKEFITDIYDDLSRHAKFAGILFSDDAVLADVEDASKEALLAFKTQYDLKGDLRSILDSPELAGQWTKYKTEYLIDFTHQLAEVVGRHQSSLKTARNLFARPVMMPESRHWFAQDLNSFVKAYDQVALMAMPGLDEISKEGQQNWLEKLLNAVRLNKDALQKVVFELQSVDWRKPGRPDMATEYLVNSMRFLQMHGAINLAYYPDDFVRDHPQQDILHTAFSLQWFPYQ